MNNDNQSSEVKTKNITLGLIFSWAFSIFVGVGGIGELFSKPLPGVLLILTALVVFPPANKELKKKFNFSLSGGVKTLIVVILMVITGTLLGNSAKPTSNAVSIPATPDQVSATSAPAQTATTQTTAQQVLLSVSGSGTKTTKTFTAAGDWTLNWSYDCSNFGNQGNFQVFVYNSSGSMSFENGAVNQLGKSGSDTEYYHSGGSYYLEVNSECKWTMQVKG